MDPRSRSVTSALRVVGLAVAVVLLSGCAPLATPHGPAAESETTSVPRAEVPGFSARRALSLDLVPGIHTLTRTDEVNRIFAQWLAVPGHTRVEAAQRNSIDETIASFLDELGKAPNGTGPAPELSIAPELTGASDAMLGIRSRTTMTVGHTSSTRYRTQWFELKSGRALRHKELFVDAAAWQTFLSIVNNGLPPNTASGGADPEVHALQQPTSLNFDAAGDALVEFGENTVAQQSSGNIVVKVPAAKMDSLLGVRGQQVRDAGRRPTGLRPPKSAPPAPGSGARVDKPTANKNPDSNKFVDCRKVKCVALTFDDGPGPKTGQVLDMLKQANAAATFFVVGPNAELRPKMLVRMMDEGHEIGNHTWNHRMLTSLAPEKLANEIGATARTIGDATGVAPTLMRPPYGALNSKVKKAAGSPVILWDVDTLDWKVLNTSKVVSNTLRDTRPGSIVLMHDIHSTTVEAVPQILKGLRSKGYHFVTVSDLLASANPQDGSVYGRGPGTKQSKPN